MNMLEDKNTFDPTYAQRYVERNESKVQSILSRLDNPSTVLDMGCNAGYVDAAVLRQFPQAQCLGVELEESVVDAALLANDRFQLTVSDVVDFQFERSYDAVIFNAVLHHVLGKYGKEAAFRLWTDIIDHTNNELFFETGIAAEKGDYYWKDAILREFGGDELYYSELIRRIGPRLKRMDVVAELPIHDAVRLLHRFELHPQGSEHDLKSAPERIYQSGYLDDAQYEQFAEYRRTEGSNHQQLIDVTDLSKATQKIFEGTHFFRLRERSSGEEFFAKRIMSDPLKQMREYQIHAQLSHSRILPCVGVSQEYGLVFPWFDSQPLTAIDWSAIDNRDAIAEQIRAFFQEAESLHFEPGRLDIDPLTDVTSRNVIDTVDLHANNFMVRQESGSIIDWRVIDLEHYTNSNRARNERHLKSIQEIMAGTTKRSWLQRLGLRR